MKYSEKCLWKAVDVFCPSYTLARISGVYMNLPECIKGAAEVAFMQCETVEYKTGIKYHVASIIREALIEMNTVGWMSFGDQDEFISIISKSERFIVFGCDSEEEDFVCCFDGIDESRSCSSFERAKALADELKNFHPLTAYRVVDDFNNTVYVAENKKD